MDGAATTHDAADADTAKEQGDRWSSAMSAFAGPYVRQVLLIPSYGVDACRRRWRTLTSSLFDPYRPELHYMRGPGPKWREKHGQVERTAPQ